MNQPSLPQDNAASSLAGPPGAAMMGLPEIRRRDAWWMISLPWALSLLLHTLLIALAATIIYAVRNAGPGNDLALTSFEQTGDLDTLQAREDQLLSPDEPDLIEPPIQIDKSQADLSKLNVESTASAHGDLSIVGIGGESESGLDAWRMMSGQGARGPKASFFGQEGRGHRIVYVIDRSGSMLESFDFLRQELKRSIHDLRHSQKFHVILFNSDYVEMTPPRLLPAIGINKKKSYGFLDGVRPAGMTDPIPAMEQAFRLKPDLIYFLTDGEFQPLLVDKLRKWNRHEKVKIYTLAYVYAPGAELLRRIADENGGTYRFVPGPWGSP